jgi:hypothetical protein
MLRRIAASLSANLLMLVKGVDDSRQTVATPARICRSVSETARSLAMRDAIGVRRCVALTGMVMAACLALPASSQEAHGNGPSAASDAPNPHDFSNSGRPHLLPWRDPAASKGPANGAGPVNGARTNSHTLTYYGGPVVSNINVVKVLYGTGTYQPFVSGTGAGTLSAFYHDVVGSTYFAWLNNDYKTKTQAIGYGTFAGDYMVTPSAANNGATITDANIQAEVLAQIASGALPAPTDNTYYAIHFPKGKKIQQGSSYSCQSGGFCAYHGTIKSSQTAKGGILYGVLPDNSSGSGCDAGCGTSTPFNNWTSVSSHELIETVTDPFVGLATTYASPLAWYNKTYGEIGDICNAQQGTITAGGVTYTVQKEWSNSKNACIVGF